MDPQRISYFFFFIYNQTKKKKKLDVDEGRKQKEPIVTMVDY